MGVKVCQRMRFLSCAQRARLMSIRTFISSQQSVMLSLNGTSIIGGWDVQFVVMRKICWQLSYCMIKK